MTDRFPTEDCEASVQAGDRIPASRAPVPVLRPLLPDAARVLPYLQRIDANRTYSNFGPLAVELEQRLATLLGLPEGGVATAGSGLSAIVGAILAVAGRADAARPLALVPAYTFVATAVAVEQCGYAPHLADIDPATWLLDPQALLDHPQIERIGLVVPVATLGRAVPQAPWQDFSVRTGIPIVIDGAASIEAIQADPPRYLGSVPVALSFHATKGFGTGEGGAVVGTDVDQVARALRALNFGFYGSRDSRSASTNGKMSEYHAAVGLAELDGWADKQRAMRRVGESYQRAFAARALAARLHPSPELGAGQALFLADDAAQAARITAAFTADDIGFRLWYGLGLHHQTYYRDLPRDALTGTDDLAPRLIGLPFAPDLADAQIARVVDAVAAALAGG